MAEFSLFDKNNNGIYQTTFALKGTPGIINFSLPLTAPPLEIGKDYQWSFAMICKPEDRLQDRVVRGWLRRTKPKPALMSQLKEAVPQERIALYAAAGIWYDELTTLYELRRSQPDTIAAKPLRK